jgi:Ran GTPase-activating protein (RanGAP) involved in mRNA processing and transport
MSALQVLDLQQNEIGDTGCCALVPALQSMSSLQKLDLRLNFIGDEGVWALESALQSLSLLQAVVLENNQITMDREELLTRIAHLV